MKTKAQKQKILEGLAEQVKRQKSMVFVDFQGLKVKDLLSLRRQLTQVDAKLQVAKKTLLQRVLNEKKIAIDLKKFRGEIAAIFSFGDPISAIKAAYQFAKGNENIRFLGGYFENQIYEPAVLQEIASLPAKEMLLARLVEAIISPMSGFLEVLQGNTKGLIRVLAKAKI